jgi:hypothetical protein
MLTKYETLKLNHPTKVHAPQCAELFVRDFVQHYEQLHQTHMTEGRPRKTSALSSAQSYISQFKKQLTTRGAPVVFLNALHLTRDEIRTLNNEKNSTVHAGAIDLYDIKGDAIIVDCRKFLLHSNPMLIVIGLACLTGRRMAEIMHSVTFDPPVEKHFTSDRYWTSVRGILKRRTSVEKAQTRDVPLLAPRNDIVNAVRKLRAALPASSPQDVNKRYAKHVGRAMHKYCPIIGKLHQFRKFYVLCCFHYFNERNCSLPRIASDYLGHKALGQTVITYLNFKVSDLGSLNFSY